MSNPYQVVRDFEKALCEYTGAPYVVTVNSCTMALLLSCAYLFKDPVYNGLKKIEKIISIPKKTYVGVPNSIIHAGGKVSFRDEDWTGKYRLKPYPLWDCAKRFTSGMYLRMQFKCISFHSSKILGDTQGGAILHDNPEADVWLRKARFDGRTEGVAPKDDTFNVRGWHCYMSPDVAARLLLKLSSLPLHNDDLPNDDYPDLSKCEIFK